MTRPVVPDSHEDLLTRPLFCHLGTVRHDGAPQVNPMWVLWEDGDLSFTTSTTRVKYHNLQRDNRVSVSLNDPEQPYRFLEVRGRVHRIVPDPDGVFFRRLATRYGRELHGTLPPDVATRVRLVIRPEVARWQ
ncbi:PPOX class F420-dependent oxidoreductase [Actinokineospora sp. PR83]|uniref:PPOX class F420-dependent oxidoreductase n=1 Tax=Actinokineospora sp. PR83 TaxID=2884908 RepID=UPI001F30D5FC|nr:PPOX class F420-dependent oxidoreductase [Actinokineospora sp. PR83]MCG8917186.1 PPOX class F420-dependent oxidoreductase [Actinokineospora sp. PR83]